MNKFIHPLQQHSFPQTKIKGNQVKRTTQFHEILQQATKLKISKHAEERMKERNIVIDNETWQQINKKMLEAKQKGVTDALVVVDDARLIVSTKNNTVVTALHETDTNNKIFTNINGTIIL